MLRETDSKTKAHFQSYYFTLKSLHVTQLTIEVISAELMAYKPSKWYLKSIVCIVGGCWFYAFVFLIITQSKNRFHCKWEKLLRIKTGCISSELNLKLQSNASTTKATSWWLLIEQILICKICFRIVNVIGLWWEIPYILFRGC